MPGPACVLKEAHTCQKAFAGRARLRRRSYKLSFYEDTEKHPDVLFIATYLGNGNKLADIPSRTSYPCLAIDCLVIIYFSPFSLCLSLDHAEVLNMLMMKLG